MSGYLLLKLASCAISLVMATVLRTRTSGRIVNRQVGLLMLCGAQWSFCELMWNAQTEPEAALMWMRASALGWMWLGPICFQVFIEMLGDRAGGLRRLVPVWYAAAAAGVLVYAATPWAIGPALPTAWGWGYAPGPLLSLAYAPSIAPTFLSLLLWKRVQGAMGSSSERRRARFVVASVLLGLTASVASDVVLPSLGVRVPGFGSLCIAMIGSLIVFNLHRYGYLLLSPAAFAREILETLRDGVALVQNDGKVRSVNHTLEEIAEAGPGQLAGRPISDLLPDFRRSGLAGLSSRRMNLRTLAGALIPVQVTSLALRSKRGFLLGEALVVRDLREVVDLRRRLVTAGRLAAVGELSSRISHEISQPVNAVLCHLESLRAEWDRVTGAARGPVLKGLEKTFAEGEEMIDECLEGVERVAEVVSEVESFSRFETGSHVCADVSLLAERALRLAAPSAPAGVRLHKDLAAVSQVWCAPHKLERVVLNLLLNAIHAVEGEGTVRLSTEEEGGVVRIRVDDDGCGISPADSERIFDPFFSTKPVGEGTGLGLSISYHIVQGHSGDIQVESRPGEGTSFTIELPVSRA